MSSFDSDDFLPPTLGDARRNAKKNNRSAGSQSAHKEGPDKPITGEQAAKRGRTGGVIRKGGLPNARQPKQKSYQAQRKQPQNTRKVERTAETYEARSLKRMPRRRQRITPAQMLWRRFIILALIFLAVAIVIFTIFKAVSFFVNRFTSDLDQISKKTNPNAYVSSLPTPTACLPSELATTVKHSGQYTKEKQNFALTIENISNKPCLIEVGPTNLYIVYLANEQTVANSKDCVTEAPKKLLLAAKEKHNMEITWDAKTSTAGCSKTRTNVLAGKYAVKVMLGNNALSKQNTQFSIVDKPSPSAPPSAKPTTKPR